MTYYTNIRLFDQNPPKKDNLQIVNNLRVDVPTCSLFGGSTVYRQLTSVTASYKTTSSHHYSKDKNIKNYGIVIIYREVQRNRPSQTTIYLGNYIQWNLCNKDTLK